MSRQLTINWIEARPSLSGGVKSNRLLAEAMARRGHHVTISHLPPTPAFPPIWRVRTFAKRLRKSFEPGRFRHHLEHAEVPTNQLPTRTLDPAHVPDADVTIASWWAVWREIAAWPASKGLKVHMVRGHETYAGDEAEIAAAYRIPGPRAVISSWLERIMLDYGHSDIVRVPNGLRWDQFDSQPRGKQPVPTIGILASAQSVKQTTVGLEAIRKVQERLPEARVVAFAPKAAPDDWQLPDHFKMHVRPEQSLIPKLYQSCDVWVTCSASEGFGMPGLEAAAGHCPLVSTRCGGPEDYIKEDVNGHLVDIGDADALADAILKVLTTDDERWRAMSAASYEIAKDFDWDRSAERLEAALFRWLDERSERAA